MSEGLPGTNRVNVKGLRERLGLSQAEFADKMHVDERTIRRWEHGASRPSPMAMAHMRALPRPQHEQTTIQAPASTQAELPRRRMPTF